MEDVNFIEFYKMYNKKLAAYVYAVVQDFEAAQDVLQETWIALWAKWNPEQLKKIDNLYAYTVGISRIYIIKHLQEKNKRLRKYDYVLMIDIERFCPDEFKRIVSTIMLKEITRFMNKQDAPLAKIFKMYFLDGLNSVEIGKDLGIPAATVRTHIRKIRNLIKQKFDR